MASPLLSFLFFAILFFSVHSELCNPQDKKVLLQIKKDLNNPYVLSSWEPDTDCCHWYVVKCDRVSHRIISFDLFADSVSFQIPASVGDLTHLETLDFHKLPNLTGPIQPAIAKLKNLKFLRIDWTNISGPIPDFLSELKNLTYVNLAFNNLSGSIPPSLARLHNLGALFLSRNKLTGSIPYSFGTFSSVTDMYLDLSHNQLSGTIPPSFAIMNFFMINLSRNKLVGDASVVFGANKTTQNVDLSRNLFQFDLSKAVFPKSLTSLDLNHNKITGSIPVEMTALNLQLLNVSYNRLCGQIPAGGDLQRFDYSSYFHISVCAARHLQAASDKGSQRKVLHLWIS